MRVLSRDMREGIKLHPEQAFGELYSPIRIVQADGHTTYGGAAACAMGAVLSARMHHTVTCVRDRIDATNQLEDRANLSNLYSILKGRRACPEQSCHFKRCAIDGLIAHLNDGHRWTRERIADWVEMLELESEMGSRTQLSVADGVKG